MTDLALSLISHTNVGKTTLARTLLRRDVGEVLDQAHVTGESERFVLLDAGDGGRIVLWDTPGFGDSARLYGLLREQDDPIDWLDRQSFDPHRERPLYSSREAVRNVRDGADVVLYLVNASEDPAMAGYVEPEMRILAWIDKPVIVLLNQTGDPADTETRRREEERWRWHLASFSAVHDVMGLDAFSRCWVQEGLLLLRLEALVPTDHRGSMERLVEHWAASNLEILERCAAGLAGLLWWAASDREEVGDALLSRVARKRAADALGGRLEGRTRRTIEALIDAYGLEGEAATWARGALSDVAVPGERPDPRKAGAIGGVAGGALGGLIADLAGGGLSFGGGTVAGAILGGLGLGGLAWVYEQTGSKEQPVVIWSTAFLERLLRDGLLRYLAVAHYGRGAGAFRERLTPSFWAPAVESTLESRRRRLARMLRPAREGEDREVPAELCGEVLEALVAVLLALYPGSDRLLRRDRARGR